MNPTKLFALPLSLAVAAVMLASPALASSGTAAGAGKPAAAHHTAHHMAHHRLVRGKHTAKHPVRHGKGGHHTPGTTPNHH